ncbi:MAG: hypothetical protein ACRBBQ_15895 [Cognatishimia sp.]
MASEGEHAKATETVDPATKWNGRTTIIAAAIGAVAVLGAAWISTPRKPITASSDDHLICTNEAGEIGKVQAVPATNKDPAHYSCVAQ